MSRPRLLHQAEAPFKIPASTAITDLFLTAALRHGGVIGADVTARKTSQEKLSGGAHADVVRIRMAFEPSGSGPATIVGKFTPQDKADKPARWWRDGLVNEINAIHLLRGAPLPRPRTYFAGGNTRRNAFVILMADMHMPCTDIVAGISVQEARASLILLAKHHATYWGGPDRLGGPVPSWGGAEADKVFPFLGDHRSRLKSGLFDSAYAHPLRDTASLLPPDVGKKMKDVSRLLASKRASILDTFAPNRPPHGKPLHTQYAITLCVANLRADNLFIAQTAESKAAEDAANVNAGAKAPSSTEPGAASRESKMAASDLDVTTIDWASMVWSHPMVDVVYLIVTSLGEL